jgi:signal peptidase I
MQENNKIVKNTNPAIKSIIEQVELFVLVLAVMIFVFSFVLRTCKVSGDSMDDTLINNENVLVSNIAYTPERGDIIVFHQTGTGEYDYNEPIVKRVIGVAGDTVEIEHLKDSMIVTITDSDGNSTILKEDYIKYDYPSYSNSTTYVEEGTVFVLGDNRSHSGDSRLSSIGLVDTRRILGKVFFRVTPFSRFGVID